MYAPINNRHNIQKRQYNGYVAGRGADSGSATCGDSQGPDSNRHSLVEVCKLYSILLLLWRPDINPAWAPWPKKQYSCNYAYERYETNTLVRPSFTYWGDYTE